MARKVTLHTFLSAAGEAGEGTVLNASNIDELFISVAAPTSTLTVKIFGSVGETEPDWEAAISNTNLYTGLELLDVNDTTTPIVGTTGFALSGAGLAKVYRVNLAGLGLSYINCVVTAWTSGSVTVVGNAVTHNR